MYLFYNITRNIVINLAKFRLRQSKLENIGLAILPKFLKTHYILPKLSQQNNHIILVNIHLQTIFLRLRAHGETRFLFRIISFRENKHIAQLIGQPLRPKRCYQLNKFLTTISICLQIGVKTRDRHLELGVGETQAYLNQKDHPIIVRRLRAFLNNFISSLAFPRSKAKYSSRLSNSISVLSL